MTAKSMQACAGFSLVEFLVGLTISTVLLSLIVRVYDANHRLFLTNKALSDVFYDGQFIIPLLNSNIAVAGNTNVYSASLNNQVDINQEANFISENPVATELTFSAFPLIASIEGNKKGVNKPDQIVINTIAAKSCTGTYFDFNVGELFHVVNQYYLDGTTLRCKSYDGRYLRGVKSTTRSRYSVSLLENVYDLQVQYAVKIKDSVNEQEFIWLNADSLTSVLTKEVQVIAVNIVLLLGVDTVTGLSKQNPIKVLGNNPFIVPNNVIIRKFETIVLLKV